VRGRVAGRDSDSVRLGSGVAEVAGHGCGGNVWGSVRGEIGGGLFVQGVADKAFVRTSADAG